MQPLTRLVSIFYFTPLCAVLACAAIATAHAQSAPAQRQTPGAAPAQPPAGAPPVAVEVAKAVPATLADEVAAVGSVRASESVMLRPEISGRIAQIQFREGQPVKKGQVLVSLDASVLAAEIAQTRAELDLSRGNLKRTEDLAAKNFVSERARDEAASNLQVQQARLALSEARYAKSFIRAPFNGVAGVRLVAVGDYVKEGADMVSVEDTATVKIDFRLPERYLSQVRAGQKFSIVSDALPGKQYTAAVELVDPQIDASTRSFLVRGRLTNDGSLRAGMFARVRLALSDRASALMVPEEAVTLTPGPNGNASYVFKVSDGKAVRTQVQTGLRRNAMVEIKSGLNPGDQVITAGQIKIRGNEAAVRVVEAPKPSGAANGAGVAPTAGSKEPGKT